jgi:hypothetical protein
MQYSVIHMEGKKICEYYNVSADYILGLEKGMKWPGGN